MLGIPVTYDQLQIALVAFFQIGAVGTLFTAILGLGLSGVLGEALRAVMRRF